MLTHNTSIILFELIFRELTLIGTMVITGTKVAAPMTGVATLTTALQHGLRWRMST